MRENGAHAILYRYLSETAGDVDRPHVGYLSVNSPELIFRLGLGLGLAMLLLVSSVCKKLEIIGVH